MTDDTVAFRIHHAPKETVELFKKTVKFHEKVEKEGKGWTNFQWSFKDRGFVSFVGEIFSSSLSTAEKRGVKDITLVKSKSKTLISFFGPPDELKVALERIFKTWREKRN